MAAAGTPLLALGARARAAGPAVAPPSIDDLIRAGLMTGAAISPTGRRIAVARYADARGGDDGALEPWIYVRDAEALDAPPHRIRVAPAAIERVEWASDERLLVWLIVAETRRGELLPVPLRRVIAMDPDGGRQIVLFRNQKRLQRKTFESPRIVDMLPGDDRQVLMQVHDHQRGVETLFRVDVMTGQALFVERGGASTDGWHTQDGAPVLRFSTDRADRRWSVEARAPGQRRWKTLRSIDKAALGRDDFRVAGTTREPGVLLVLTHAPDAQTNALRRFDTRDMSFGPVVAQRPDHDIDAAFVDENGDYVGAAWTGDRTRYAFDDPDLARHYRGVERFFGEECNVALADISGDRRRLLLQVTGPREPGAWFFYDLATARLEPLGADRPWLSRERLGRTEPLRVKTRDGAEITAYLTTPIQPGRRPLVVLPHGGPELRDSMVFDPFVQALAARGWAVLQPNFRGSSGYGRAFADAGRRRWGDRLQEDVEDAVAHALAASPGLDRDRIAICGASYGGYAALMGVARGQVRYRRAVSIAGVSDLPSLMAFEREADGKDTTTYDYFRRTIGDPDSDAALLEAASPARRAAAITAPVLLIHGRLDFIAPYEQSRTMARALAAAGKPHRFETLDDAGHQNWSEDHWRRIIALTTDFLAEGFGEG